MPGIIAPWGLGLRRSAPLVVRTKHTGIDELELAAQHCATHGEPDHWIEALLSGTVPFSLSPDTALRIVDDVPGFEALVKEYVAGDAMAMASNPLEIEAAMAADDPSDDWATETDL